jgi:protein-disulfide isomerase
VAPRDRHYPRLQAHAGSTQGARRRLTAALLASLALLGCERAASGDDAAFGEKVRAYLLAHPEVLREVSQKLDAKDAADEDTAHRRAEASLPSVRAALEHDPADFTANPKGRITVTEFYDYRCPHCVNVAPKVLALIQAHPDVRFVFKEMPIFGPVSEHAAQAAWAVKKSGGDYVGLYRALMAARGLDDAAIDRIALAHGAKPADLGPSGAGAVKVQIARNTRLFNQLDLGGTPAFIIGDQIIAGEDMDSLNAAVAKAEAKRA